MPRSTPTVEPRPSVTRFVTAVVRFESARAGAAHDSEVIQRIMTRLHQELGKLIGSAGFDVMLARSLVLARRTHPLLTGIMVGPGSTLTGLDQPARDPDALQESMAAVVSHFIEILVNLIGEDLAMRLVRDVWPAAAEEQKK
jgi:hypothetical protein